MILRIRVSVLSRKADNVHYSHSVRQLAVYRLETVRPLWGGREVSMSQARVKHIRRVFVVHVLLETVLSLSPDRTLLPLFYSADAGGREGGQDKHMLLFILTSTRD